MFDSRELQYSKLLKFSLHLADVSSKILNKKYYELISRKKIDINIKSDGSPVTEVDIEVERALRVIINKKFPKHKIYGEEFGMEKNASEAEFLWIIDPIDGTKSFITGNPLFGTLISLLHNQRPILGVIDMPVLKQRYWGMASTQSLTKNITGTFKPILKKNTDLESSILETTSPDYFKTSQDKKVLERIKNQVQLVRYGGDCFCFVSMFLGLIDIVLEIGLAPYDYFSMIPVLEGLGGIITDWQGKPLDINKPSPKILACTNLKLHKKVLEKIKN